MLKIEKDIILRILRNIITVINKSDINFYTINKIINLIKYEISICYKYNLSKENEETMPVRPLLRKKKKKKKNITKLQ
tara:strand:+ start:56 stop:289 length:234 start_codon:yes stop_codon:yes gene_type:complete